MRTTKGSASQDAEAMNVLQQMATLILTNPVCRKVIVRGAYRLIRWAIRWVR